MKRPLLPSRSPSGARQAGQPGQVGQLPQAGHADHAGASRARWRRAIPWLVAAALLALGVTLASNWFKSSWRARWRRAPASASASALTFSKDIAPIIFQRCATCHHPGESAPFSLLNYEDVRKLAPQIAEVTARRIMPPWLPEPGCGDFVGQRFLSEEQIRLIQEWVGQGAPAGDARDMPAPPQWRDGWQLGAPDLILQLPRPYALAAEGPDVYRNFVIPIPVSSRRLVKAVELLPGNARVLHHAFMLIDPTRDSRRRDELDPEPGFPGLHTPPSAQTPPGQFLSWQPGKQPTLDPDDLAWPLEKGSDLILQVHLRPSGKPEWIQPSVGLYFTTGSRPAKRPFKLGLWTHAIDIPAGAPRYIVRESYVLPVDVDVLKVLPHAHYLARRLEGMATLPDGTAKWLFRIPNWDFNWQGDYSYASPVFLPKGTTIAMQYTYDNSTNNARNPNQPPQPVRYGLNSTDEMAEMWLQLLPRNTNDLAILEKDYQPRVFQSAVSYNTYLLGLDPGNARAHTEIGRASLFLNRPAEALTHLQQALQLQPEDDDAHYYLGLLFRLQGRLVDAKAHFRNALRLNPTHFKAHGNLGLILLEEGNLDEAQLHFQNALQINPEDAIARESLEQIARTKLKQ